MHVILRFSTLPSVNVLKFVRSCHKTAWNLNKYVRNYFNIRASVTIYTKLYTCKIRVYDIEYFSGACLLASNGRALVVC